MKKAKTRKITVKNVPFHLMKPHHTSKESAVSAAKRLEY
jgi:hypothetical protein